MTGTRRASEWSTHEQRQVLDEDGEVVDGATVPDLADDELLEMYREMRYARHFDQRAVSLQRQGRMGTYSPLSGQEGAQVGSVHAVDDEDWLSYQYREHAAVVHRGDVADYLQYWMGHERGNASLLDARVLPLNISIAGHIPHVAGMAMASRIQDADSQEAFLCYFGDGATSEGDFHEGLNFAGVFDAPAIFFCNNNQWAISVPRERQTASETIAQKATAYGFEGVQVDGMDPLAVYQVTREAVEKARDPGEGERRPTLIEAVQYRFGAHTTADDPTAYRDEAEVERWKRKDPISRFEAFLLDTGRLDDEAVAAVEDDVEEQVADAIEAAEAAAEAADPAEMFEYTYAEPTPRLLAQQAAFAELRERYGDEALLEE